jgi:hypothetical protein
MTAYDIMTFSLDPEAAHAVKTFPKYRRGHAIGRSAHVSRAIRQYKARLQGRDTDHVVGLLNDRIEGLQRKNAELELQISKYLPVDLESDPQVGGKTVRGGIFRHLYLRLRRKQAGR